jgi:hypothetical protein
MNNFEEYSVKSWLDEGMTRHPPRAASANGRIDRKPWPVNLLIPFIAATAVAFVTHAPVAIATPGARASHAEVSATDDGLIIWGSPAIYWSKAIADLRAWRPVSEPDVESPPPLF